MVKAQSVEHLMLDGVVVNAAWSLQGQILTIVTTANVGVTPVMTITTDVSLYADDIWIILVK